MTKPMTPEETSDLRETLGGRVIHLNGYPGSGKKTIGTIISGILGGRLIDNHVVIDPAMAVYDHSEEGHYALRREIQRVVHAAAKTLPPDVPIVTTGVFFEGAGHDVRTRAAIRRLSRARGHDVVHVNLILSEEENERRLLSPGRVETRKLRNASMLGKLRERMDLEGLHLRSSLNVVVSDLSAEDAADMILQAVASRLALAAGKELKTGSGKRRSDSV